MRGYKMEKGLKEFKEHIGKVISTLDSFGGLKTSLRLFLKELGYTKTTQSSLKSENKRYNIWEVQSEPGGGWVEVVNVDEIIDKNEFDEAVHGSILSMGKYKEGEIKAALEEFIGLLSKRLDLE